MLLGLLLGFVSILLLMLVPFFYVACEFDLAFKFAFGFVFHLTVAFGIALILVLND